MMKTDSTQEEAELEAGDDCQPYTRDDCGPTTTTTTTVPSTTTTTLVDTGANSACLALLGTFILVCGVALTLVVVAWKKLDPGK